VRTTLPLDNLATFGRSSTWAGLKQRRQSAALGVQPARWELGTLLGDYNNLRWLAVSRMVRGMETTPGRPVVAMAKDDGVIVQVWERHAAA